MRYNVFFEYDAGGTDWAALYANSEQEARAEFLKKYDGWRIIRVERVHPAGQPEGWN